MENTNTKPEKGLSPFTEAALPLIKYLCENHNPHCSIIVTPTGAELLEGSISTGEILDYLRD